MKTLLLIFLLAAEVFALGQQVTKNETQVRINDRIQEQNRLNFETQEALKREQQQQQLELKSDQEKEKIKQLAVQKARQAFQYYRKANYKAATQFFEAAASLDPENDLYFYQYGVCLYKIGNYNKSLAVLSLVEGGDQNPLEHKYYVALNHLKLNELEKSVSNFNDLKAENDKRFSPTSAFFAGNIEFQRNKYRESREHFQYVLDNSSDPKLDRESELKLEEIDRIENYLESQKEIFRYAFYIGPQYDGNALNISTQNLATNSEAYRLMYGGFFTYNTYRTMKSLYSLELGYNDMYSVDKNFKSDSTIQSVDPLQLSIRLPMKHQWKLISTDFFSGVSPYYTTLSMSDSGGVRKQILSSAGLTADLTWSVKNNWAHILRLDYASDNSTLQVSSDDDKQSSKRTVLGYNLLKMLNPRGDKSILGDISYVQNSAVGKNSSYNKYILGLSYNFPWSAKYRGSSKLEYIDLKYPHSSTARKDSMVIASLGASQDLSRNKNISLNIGYNLNNSNIDSYKYNKLMIGFLFTYSGLYLKK
ncbi:MAG: hypothetical protein B7Y39_18880 [Bdellovibrio sp. 28-41-41]|nr:MAG: hypothetical protein B7Y39_18880 [Bdellovibrio sp. 28-41-41]